MRKVLIGGVVGMSLLLGVAGGAAAAPNDNASEVGHCSSFYGRQQVRDDISRDLASQDFPPGAFYSEAAKNKGGANCGNGGGGGMM